jgi:tetratricopeptide (TPR) repeat protein
LLVHDPANPAYLNLRAAILANLGEYSGSIELYEAVLREFPKYERVWLSYGHALKTAHRFDESVTAYRRAIQLVPSLGEAYWTLANLKTFRFTAAEVEALRAALGGQDLTAEDRLHFEFALGKALEDGAAYAESFAHYSAGCAIRKRLTPYRAEETTEHVRRARALYTSEFFTARSGSGATAPDPIFVLGLPRAGSTLVEQILASHPQVEGTMELPDIPSIARQLARREPRTRPISYLDVVASLTRADLQALGESYLARTRVQRKTGAPFFVDKMPNNWLHAGFIHLILPNAKIIDVRRHPLACCFSNFKQHFARGQDFSYDLEDIGRYYRDYVELMANFDAVLPGRVHRVFYERLVEDTEGEVRRLLEHCGLPFDPRCLQFHENPRAVRTASSEQVRRPIFRDGVDHWRHFEPWLDPLKVALGPALERHGSLPTAAAIVDAVH